MADVLKPDLCVIGAGSGGLSVAAIAASFGVPRSLDRAGPHGRRLSQRWLRALEGVDRRRRAGAGAFAAPGASAWMAANPKSTWRVCAIMCAA